MVVVVQEGTGILVTEAVGTLGVVVQEGTEILVTEAGVVAYEAIKNLPMTGHGGAQDPRSSDNSDAKVLITGIMSCPMIPTLTGRLLALAYSAM